MTFPSEDGGLDLRAGFDFLISIGSKLDANLEAQRRLLRQLNNVTPVMYRTSASAPCPSPTASFALDLGSPSLGTFWEVREVAIGGVEVTTAAAGTAGLYVSGQPAAVGAGLGNAVDYASSLPNVSYYGTGALYVRPNEHLFAVIFAGTAGQTYVANAFARVYQDRVLEDWIG